MTEAEWLACADPRPMVRILRRRASDRKVRLFACACCRHNWDSLSAAARRLIEASEGFADGMITPVKLDQVLWKVVDGDNTTCAVTAACWSANPQRNVVERAPFEAMKEVASRSARSASSKRWKAARAAELLAQAALLRCVVGNPFRPIAFDPVWRTDTAVTLARTMYAAREFSTMPILADALQDAGCDSDDILSHCRDANATHVRGCWVVDLVLGKE